MGIDLTLVTYFVVAIVLIYNFLLFAGWFFIVKKEGGKVSCIYIIVMLLFVAHLYSVSLSIFLRLIRFGDQGLYQYWLSSPLWDSRLLPDAILFIALAVLLTRRFVLSYLFKAPDYRRAKGRRSNDKN